MAVIYTLSMLALCVAFISGLKDIHILKKKVNGQFTKSITPNTERMQHGLSSQPGHGNNSGSCY